MNWKLFGVGFVLAVAFNIWAFSLWQDAKAQNEDAAGQQVRVFELLDQIGQLKAESISKIAIMPKNYDFAPEIASALRATGIQLAGSLNKSRMQSIDGANLEFFSIRNPIKEPVSLRQLLQFIGTVYDSKARYNIGSLTLRPAEGETGDEEKWFVEFDLISCERSSEE